MDYEVVHCGKSKKYKPVSFAGKWYMFRKYYSKKSFEEVKKMASEMGNLQKELYNSKYSTDEIKTTRNILSNYFGKDAIDTLSDDQVMFIYEWWYR